jgi:hypothetical protein
MASRSASSIPANVNLTFYTASQYFLPSGALNVGTAGQYQIWSDRAIWDTTNNVFIPPTIGGSGTGFNPYLMFGD